MINHAGELWICFRTKLFSVTKLPFAYQGRWIVIIQIILWSQNPHQGVEHVRDSPKVYVLYAVSRKQVYGPFSFAQTTSTGHAYLDMLEHFLVPQLGVNSVLWQDGASPHYHRDLTRYLNQKFPRGYTGRCGYIPCPPRSPDVTAMDFSIRGFVRNNVYIPPTTKDLQELCDKIVNATALVDVTFLNKLWGELEYIPGICRITKSSHTEHL
jgi:hypothetical protein